VTNVLRLAAHDPSAARSFAVTLQGKHLMDGIRARVAQLERLISSSQTERERSAHHTANSSIAEAIVVLVLLTLLIAALGGYLGRLVVARERARDQSEEMTRTLQQSIMPSAVPEIPGCELATRFIPGGGAVSGDFYDVLEVEPGGWALIIGDVCGKGAPAAAATAMARWTLRSALAQGATPAEALRLLNSVVLRQGPHGQFVTAACIRLTLEPESARLVIACAGHPAPIVVPSHDAPVTVAAEGDLLGILPTIHLYTAELQLRPGDSLVAYTDGVTDQGSEIRRSPELALADRRPGDGARQLAQILEDLASHPVGRHPDDIAILALRFLGHGVRAAQPAMEPQTQGREI
jgi:sigma-B regulation protein RsbU (phosphoserine phosphatase)